jgi:adenine/guanine phosphoribosyltransferase-like PRPP-binding protein
MTIVPILNLTSQRVKTLFEAARHTPVVDGTHLDEATLVGYASEELASEQRDDVNKHISSCSSCASKIEDIVLRLPQGDSATLDKKGGWLSPHVDVEVSTVVVSARETSAQRRLVQDRVRSLLVESGSIERDGDYVLPNGLHADTHINVAQLCGSDEALSTLAELFLDTFGDVVFDTILAHGWTMAMVARRMSTVMFERKGTLVHLAETEGYNPPCFLSDFPVSRSVLVLTDVFVTGGLIEDLRLLLDRGGSTAVGFGVVAAYRPGSEFFGRVRPLCTIRFSIEAPAHCSRCGVLPTFEFNPVSCCMTRRRPSPRSPSEFLNEYPESSEFWEVIELAKACQHHHVEGNTHHLAFVDVARMLAHTTISSPIVSALVNELGTACPAADVFLVPKRKRAQMLARLVDRELRRTGRHLDIVIARQASDGWSIDLADVPKLRLRNVVIIDSAVGRGATLDNLFLLCRRSGARTIGMVTLVSRLSEAHESALRMLMGGRFIARYRFPMRPFAVYRTPDVCPVCAKRQEVIDEASDTQSSSLMNLARRLQQPKGRTVGTATKQSVQLSFPEMPDRPLLERCSRSVAAAITLNALHASRNNGMAPLKLPEVCDLRIPAKNRTAMIESLPSGISKWSGVELIENLAACLGDQEIDALWAAAASVLARETGEELGRLFKMKLTSAPHLWSTGSDATWDSIAYSIHQVAKRHYALREELYAFVSSVRKTFRSGVPSSIEKVLEVTAAPDVDKDQAIYH